jgi:putative transposase
LTFYYSLGRPYQTRPVYNLFMNTPLPRRHSTRLADYDYSQNGAYFVTLCTWQRIKLFGEIVAGEMQLNDWGKIVQQAWLQTNHTFPNTLMDLFVIMPNHLHGVIVIDYPGTFPARSSKGSLGTIIGQFKSKASKQITTTAGRTSVIPGQVWQRNYYEHIIRNESEWDRIRKYIETNPLNWPLDDENPERATHVQN